VSGYLANSWPIRAYLAILEQPDAGFSPRPAGAAEDANGDLPVAVDVGDEGGERRGAGDAAVCSRIVFNGVPKLGVNHRGLQVKVACGVV